MSHPMGFRPSQSWKYFRSLGLYLSRELPCLIVEQNVGQALEMANRAYVLENGRIALQGIACDLLVNDYVRKAYLGL